MTTLDDLSRDDMIKVLQRDRFVKEQQGARIAALLQENLELTAIIQEMQGELGELRQSQASLLSSMADLQAEGPEEPSDVT